MSDVTTIRWVGGMKFTAKDDWGNEMFADSGKEHGGEESAPSPVDYLYFASGACTGMDVVSLLHKMRQELTDYRIEIIADRRDEFPRAVERLKVVHHVKGNNLDRELVEKAVRLSDEKYCTVLASLRINVNVESELQIKE